MRSLYRILAIQPGGTGTSAEGKQRPTLWYDVHEMGVQSPDDRPFRHYTAKHRMVAWISQNLFDNITYTVRLA